MGNRHRLWVIIEIAGVLLVAVLAGRFLWRIGGQVVGTDSLYYLDVALRRIESSYILNRYGHVYLLSLFLSLAATPLEAMRLLSGVVGSLCVLLVYVCGRFVTPISTPWNGILALASFFSVGLVLDLLTRPQVDTTAMMMGLAFAAVYIFSARNRHRRLFLVLMLGGILFLSLRTKETSLAAAIVLPGLGMGEGQGFRWSILRKNLIHLGVGMMGGAVVIGVMNAWILRDPLFGLRPSEYLAMFRIAQGSFDVLPAPESWFGGYLLPGVGTIFLLYVVSGLVVRDRLDWATGLLWLVPLAQVAFLTLAMIWSTWGVVPRYFGFSMGLMCALAGQVVGPIPRQRLFEKPVQAYLLLAAVVLGGLGGFGLLLRSSAPFPTYFGSILGPFLLALMLGLLFTQGSESPRIQPAVLLCALILTVYPARLGLGGAAAQKPANARFEPFVAFQGTIDRGGMVPAFVSLATADRLRVKDRNEVSAIFNVFFDARTVGDDFAMGKADRELRRSMAGGKYRVVLLTAVDWDAVRVGDEDVPGWRSGYDVETDSSGRFVLLRARQ